MPLMIASTGIFADREAAGVQLAGAVGALKLHFPVVVLGLPRGGVPIAFEIARKLTAPLDVMVVRKIGQPGQPELAVGAIAPGGTVVREPRGYSPMIDSILFAELVREEREELRRRERVYRAGLLPLQVKGKSVVLADDGIATGATMLAAIRAARKAGAREVIVAVPVASREAATLIGAEADQLVVLKIPEILTSVGEWYQTFEQLEDLEVCRLLEHSRAAPQPVAR